MIKIGVIGTGNMGKNHVRIISEERTTFEFSAIYDANADVAACVSQNFGNIKVAKTLDELLNCVDAVVIAVPSSMHLDIALKAAEKGVHALIEKPLALNFNDAQKICSAFEKTNTVLMVGHVERYNPVFLELQNTINNEQVIAIDMHRCSPYNPRVSDTNVIFDLMIHDIDIMCNGLNNGEIDQISAQGSIVLSGDKLDYAQTLIKFKNGIMGSITASRVTENKIRTLDIHTKDSFIHADLLSRSLQIARNTNYAPCTTHTRMYKQESIIEKVVVPSFEPLRKELLTFADCVTTGNKPITSGQTSAYAIKIAETIQSAIIKK